MIRTGMAAVAAALGLMLACSAAQAQLYHYKDANGRTVYSDSPPPAGTPPGNIMKAPKVTQPVAPAPTPAGGEAKPAVGNNPNAPGAEKDKKDGPKTTAEREADYKKRQAEAEKKAKEDAEKVAADQNRQARCAALQQNVAAMQSGQRMRKFDANGQPYFIEDNERAADVAKAQQEMSAAKCG